MDDLLLLKLALRLMSSDMREVWFDECGFGSKMESGLTEVEAGIMLDDLLAWNELDGESTEDVKSFVTRHRVKKANSI